MTIDIGKVFANMWAMVKERWLALLGLWAVFFGIMVLILGVIAGAFGGMLGAIGAGFSGGSAIDDFASLGMGLGIVLAVIVIYILFLLVAFAQQGSMIARASPLLDLEFGEAMGRGFRGSLTYLAILVLYFIASLLFGLVLTLVSLIMSFLGSVGEFIVDAAVLVAYIYLACRFCVIVPVITVDKVYNPITAINESWRMTSGHVLRILVVVLIAAVLAFLLFMVPLGVVVAAYGASLGDVGLGGAISAIITMFFVFGLLYLVFSIFSSALFASLHAEVSDNQVAALGETFE